MKQYKNINEVDKKYKFDLDDILKGKTINQLFDEYKILFNELINIKDSKYENIENFINSFSISYKTGILANKINNYINNNINRELTNSKWKQLEIQWNQINTELNEKMGSEINRFYKNIQKIKEWIKDERLSSQRKNINQQIEMFEHKLSDEIEEYLVKTANANPSYESVFSLITDSESKFEKPVDSKNKKHKLTPASRLKLMKSDDALLRKNTVKNWQKAFLQHKESLANLLHQQFTNIATEAKIRKYKNSVEMLTIDDKITDNLLLKLFDRVSSLKTLIKRKDEYFKKFYKAKFKEKYNPKYDSYRELTKIKSTYTIEEMQNLVSEALKPFGDEYNSIINKAINENWIDYMTIDNKISGAYSIGETYGIDKKYILMNFDGDLSSVETLAHELGHSLHSYFSDKNNDFENSQYPIFLAEIASIFNELMLYDYLLKTTNSNLLKFKILENMIDGFIGTVFRQTLWANYEYNLYKSVENFTVNASYDSISKLYYDNLQKYSYKKNKYKKDEMIACVTVPHFYYGFYVYKYAIGQLVANYFFANYKTQGSAYLQTYIKNFLSMGDKNMPLETLKNIGVDLNDDNFYKIGFSYFEQLINEWIKIGKKIFKIK
ncbi:M3 family oligoendopeptidase [Mycoplasmopsis lipofaciens]|uniref:M3 family oligoendopeptidase n=1 Tax=Mycoplasmopsis lipofaciens TaxID=114884 RepID=UPI000485B773|nr:M3 family oligoendopeptidase [Mycoplasmopsis lipofaciens]